jgi:hypothetical protein
MSKVKMGKLSSRILAGVLLVCAIGTTPAAVPAPPVHKPSPLVIVNPHLHIPTPPAPAETHAASPKPDAAPKKAAPIPWDGHQYIALHAGLSTIQGVILNANGKPADKVRVVLRKPGGGIFAHNSLKHITHTGTNGEFTMTKVRPGSYRVFASIEKKKGFTKTTVHSGDHASVTVKI